MSRHYNPYPTDRETEVWRLIALGNTSLAIAAHLGISHKTVERHRGRLGDKLDLHNVADITRAAIAHGVIEVPTLTAEGWKPIWCLTPTPASATLPT